MFNVKTSGDQNKTVDFLKNLTKEHYLSDMQRYGDMGVEALRAATPVESGLSAYSWKFKVKKTDGETTIEWYNTNLVNGTPVVILLQYGHGTGTGGYVQGRDFINPAIQPIFDQIQVEVWKKVIAS